MQTIGLQPVGTCLNDDRANVGLQFAQDGKAKLRQSQMDPKTGGFKDPQVSLLLIKERTIGHRAQALHLQKRWHMAR